MTPSDIDIDQIREALTNRRRDIMSLRRSANRSWQRLHEPEIEAGEVQKKEDETLMEGERSETDLFAAKADGKPMAPPDTLQPEKKK